MLEASELSQEWTRDSAAERWLAKVIAAAQLGSSRSQQRRIGPSEIGTPCQRKLALKIVDGEHEVLPKREVPSLRMFVGTAVHDHIARAIAEVVNEVPPDGQVTTRAHVEVKVEVEEGLAGTADLVILVSNSKASTTTALVWDHKIKGPNSMANARACRVDATYEVQLDMYGLGVERTFGTTLTSVGLYAVPSAGDLTDVVALTRPFDRDRARKSLRRYHSARASVARRVSDAMADGRPATVDVGDIVRSTRTADDYCESCPFLGQHYDNELTRPGDDTLLCGGHYPDRE